MNEISDIKLLTLTYSWNGKKYSIEIDSNATIKNLKTQLCQKTNVPINRQKLLNLIKGKLPNDDSTLLSLNLKNNHHFIFIGTVDKDLIKDISSSNNELNDKTLKKSISEKLNKVISETEITFINKPREEKKLLVLDLDYTLIDFKKKFMPINEIMRPGVIEFLENVFPYYDIVFWSQTSWRYIELKLTEMGILTHTNFYVSFILDKTSMIKVESSITDNTTAVTTTSHHHKVDKKHYIKPLQVIWSKLPQYSEKNTLHIDDLPRNFDLNPKSGIKINPWYYSVNKNEDKELHYLSKYLVSIGIEKDLTKFDHKKWKTFLSDYKN